MTLHFIYRIIPIPVFWTDRFLKDWQGGLSCGFFCIIRSKYKDTDKGILEHELTHCRQFYRTFGMHSFAYLFSKRYRLNAEVEAYRNQLKFYSDDRTRVFAGFIATRYGLDITTEHAEQELLFDKRR